MNVAAGAAVRGVIFDLDGTLYQLPTARVHLSLRLWRSIRLLKNYGAARAALRGRSFPDARSLGEAFSLELGHLANVSPEQATQWFDQVFFTAFIELLHRRAQPRHGLLPLLGRLRSHGVKLAVVSDVGRVEDRLRALGIPLEGFDLLMCTEGCGELKPSPRAFLIAAQQLGLAPSSVLVVGDRADLDGDAARAAKMDCLIVDNRHRLRRRAPAANDARLNDWPRVVETIAARTGLAPHDLDDVGPRGSLERIFFTRR